MRICGMEGCDGKVTARGLCNPHYQMWYRGYNIPTFKNEGPHGLEQAIIIPKDISKYGLGWLIGLLEGEGHFSYDGTQQLVLQMTDEDIILKAKALLEYTLGLTKPIHLIVTNWRQEEKPLYAIRLYGAKARAIMKLIVKHMGKRRRIQIWRALNKYKPIYLKVDLKELLDANNKDARNQS